MQINMKITNWIEFIVFNKVKSNFFHYILNLIENSVSNISNNNKVIILCNTFYIFYNINNFYAQI